MYLPGFCLYYARSTYILIKDKMSYLKCLIPIEIRTLFEFGLEFELLHLLHSFWFSRTNAAHNHFRPIICRTPLLCGHAIINLRMQDARKLKGTKINGISDFYSPMSKVVHDCLSKSIDNIGVSLKNVLTAFSLDFKVILLMAVKF